MACATLKRSLDWESINQRPTKRRRCMPFGSSRHSTSNASPHMNKRRLYPHLIHEAAAATSSESLQLLHNNSPYSVVPSSSAAAADHHMFGGGASNAHQMHQMSHSHQEEEQQQHHHHQQMFSSGDVQQFDPALSADAQANAFPKITPEKMAQTVQEEIQRMASRRRQLQYQSPGNECGGSNGGAGGASSAVGAKAALERMQDSESSGSEMGSDSPRPVYTPPLSHHQLAGSGHVQGNKQQQQDKALFTFKQVRLICERMLREQEDSLREEYNNILLNKLAEQYDIFVKFTYDQIQGRYDSAPSYLS